MNAKLSSHAKPLPNIIFIMSDDQGAWAMGNAGNNEIQTPHLDRLAASGLRFNHFFCASPVCSPARASLLTGKIPSAHGVHDWIRSGNLAKEKLADEIRSDEVFQEEDKPISYLDGQTTYTKILAKHGYDCALSGKWHLGNSVTPQHGFSRWFSLGRGGCDYYRADTIKEGQVEFEKQYITDVITDRALDFLQKQVTQDRPCYLSVHYTAPHAPWDREQHPAKEYDLYEDCPFQSTPEEPIHP